MLPLKQINKSVDKERSLFGLKGIFIVAFVIVILVNMLVYMVVSSFVSSMITLFVIGGSIFIFSALLFYLNKKYGIHMIDHLGADPFLPKQLLRTKKMLGIEIEKN